VENKSAKGGRNNLKEEIEINKLEYIIHCFSCFFIFLLLILILLCVYKLIIKLLFYFPFFQLFFFFYTEVLFRYSLDFLTSGTKELKGPAYDLRN